MKPDLKKGYRRVTFDVLHNFISPVTGRVLADYNYVLVGNKAGIAIPSPILIDLRLDLINLRKRYNTLSGADFVVGHENIELPNAQILADLDDGFLFNTSGTVSTRPTSPTLPLCYAASTEDVGATYDNGDEGVGATLTSSAIGTFTIDDQTPPEDSAVLIKDQSSTFQNGIYTVTDTGSIASAWVLTRFTGYDEPGEIQPGDLVAVENGTVNSGTLWIETQTVETIGTDPILFISINLFNTLPEDNIWIGDENDRPQPNPQIGLNNLPYFLTVNPLKNFGIYNLYTGQLLGLTNPLQVGQATTTLRVDMSNMPNLSVGKMWIGVANTTPPTITIDSIPPYIHVNGSLNWDPLGLIQDSHAVPTEVGLGPKYLFIGSTDPATLNQINSTVALYIENLPPLTFNSIWRGDATGRPVESTDLTALETKVTNIQDVIIPQLEAEIAALQAELAALTAEVVELQTQIIAAAAAIAALQAQVLVIQGQFAALRLNNIPADGDVSFYGYKLINLANPVNPTDGVNLQTFENPAQFTFTNPFLNTPQITFNNLNPTSTSSGMLFTVAAANVGGIGYNNAASILYVNGYGSTAVNVGTTAANLNFSSVGDAVLTGTLYANRPAAYMYMQGNSTTTTIGTASFAKIAGTTTLSYGNEFTMPVNNRLFYINGTIASIQAYVTVSITCNFTLPDTASIVVYLNGSAITGSTISQDVVAATNVTFSTNAIIAMGTSNYIEIWLGSTVGNTVVVSSMTVSLSST